MELQTEINAFTRVGKDTEGNLVLLIYEEGSLEPPYYDRREIRLVGHIPIIKDDN